MSVRVARLAGRALTTYGIRIKSFQPNARLYLLNVVVAGAATGVFRLLFNFYVLSLGYDEALLGNLVAAGSLTGLIAALPLGYLADRLSRKTSLVLSGLAMTMAFMAMVLWPSTAMLVGTNILFGLAGGLAGVTMAPFLMENSGEKERTYLFSFGAGMQMASASMGNWIGGYLPTWIGSMRQVEATSSTAYGGAILVVAFVTLLALIPLVLMRTPRLQRSERTVFAPFAYAAKHPRLLAMLISPMLITSIGAGLIMPFMNVFFRQVYHQPDPVIGSLFAWGSLAMGAGLLVAPPLADRMGKIKLVVITQGLSIPFLILLGFSPWFWLSAAAYYVRVALMNMSGPVYQTYVMEHVDPDSRAMVASLVSMSWNFGWALSPTVSGWMQVNYGFGLPFAGTILLYVISVVLYYVFFWHRPPPTPAPVPAPVPRD